MRDKEFLLWIRERLIKYHGESEHADFIHRLKEIAERGDKMPVINSVKEEVSFTLPIDKPFGYAVNCAASHVRQKHRLPQYSDLRVTFLYAECRPDIECVTYFLEVEYVPT